MNTRIFLCLALSILAFSCGKPATPQPGCGTIRISGAWALYPLAVAWGEQYRATHPGVRIDISAGGAGKGVTDTLAGLVDLGMVSRDIAPEEVQQGCVGIPVAKDAVVCIVNAACPARAQLVAGGLNRETLKTVWMTTNAALWSHVAKTMRAEPLNVYTRSDAAGAPETWAKYLGGRQDDLKGTRVYGDPGVVEAVRRDRTGIGYCNLNFAFDPASGKPVDGTVVVPIDSNTNGIADADESVATKAQAMEAIKRGVYPSPPARDLFFVSKGAPKGVVAEFLLWTLTDGQKLVESTGYIVIASNQIAAARATVKP